MLVHVPLSIHEVVGPRIDTLNRSHCQFHATGRREVPQRDGSLAAHSGDAVNHVIDVNLFRRWRLKDDGFDGGVATRGVAGTHGAVLQICLGGAALARALTRAYCPRHDFERRLR